ncbi:unnamed protein product [Alopecurus aequalis]
MQFQSSNCAKIFARVDGSGAQDLSINPSTFGFTQDANQEYYNRALQYGYSVSRQGFEGKGFLPSGPNVVLNRASAALGEYQQFDHFYRPLQPVESDGMQVQNNGINITHRSRPSNASCLDHVEDITSHDTDGYDDRAISFGSSCSPGILCYPYSSPLQSDNSIADKQDGTWAALMQMQEALEAPNEECSDLTFNNTELSGGNTMQPQVVWDNGGLASPSFTSNFLPFPGEAEATVTNTSVICNLQNSVDLPYDNDEGISSFELNVPEYNGATTSHVCERRDEMHSVDLRTNPVHDESFDLMPVTRDRKSSISHEQFSSFVDGSVDSGMKKLHGIYDCEEQMEIDSLLNSFGASSDAFPQTYEIFQKGEKDVDFDKKVILEESISATFANTTASCTTQAVVAESAVFDGSSQQYQSTSQSCGLFYSPACQWKSMPSSVFPLGGCQNGVGESNPTTSVGTNGKEQLYSGHTSVQQQQNVPSEAELELIENVANLCQEFPMVMDGQFCPQKVHLYHNEALATQGTWAAHCDMMVPSSAHTGLSDMQLSMTQTAVHVPALSFSKNPNTSDVQGELMKVYQHHSDIQIPSTQTNNVQLPAPRFSEDPNSSFIGQTQLKKVGRHDSDMQLPLTQASDVQQPAMSLSKDPNSSLIGRTELKKVERHGSDMQLPMTQASDVQLPATNLSKDPNSFLIGRTEIKKVERHDSDIQLPMAHTSHAQLPVPSLSKDPDSAFLGETELKKVGQHDSDRQLPMTQTSHPQLPAPSLSKDPDSAFLGGTELKKVDQHDSDIQLPMTQASDGQLLATTLSKDPNSSLIGRTEIKKAELHDSDMQLPMTQASRSQLPVPSSSKDPDSAFLGGTELKKVELHDSSMQFLMTQTSHAQPSSPSLSKDPKSAFPGETELKKVEQHDLDRMQLPVTQTCHAQLPAPSLSKDPDSAFLGGTELKKVEQHDSDMQLPITQSSHAQLPAPSLSKDPDSAFLGGTELKNVDQLDDYSHIGCPQQSILLSGSKTSHSSGLPINKFDGEVGSRPLKRKRSTGNVLASHAQVMSGGEKMQCPRTLELDCAHATKRFAEKVDVENATMEYSTIVSRAQRRLSLTTSLIKRVLPVPPARLFAADVTKAGETVVYQVSKVAVSDMYAPVRSSATDADNVTQNENMPRNETSTSGKEDYDILSGVLETFDTRFGELERSLSRAEKAPTFQDFASEVRDIERWSILHRFVKLRMLQEYWRLHASDGLVSTPHPFSASILKHAEDPFMPVDSLNKIRCRVLK